MHETILRILQESENFKELERKILKYISALATKILEELFIVYDNELRDARDTKNLRLKDKRIKAIQTIFGDVRLNRYYYQDKEGKRRFLLDEKLGILPRDRISPGLKELCLDLIQDNSYRQTENQLAKTLYCSISHSAIHRYVQRAGQQIEQVEETKSKDLFEYGAVPDNEKGKEKTKLLFMEADGLSIALQGEKRKRGELKLGITYEGWEKRYPQSREYKLVKKKYYGGEFESEDFWKRLTSQTLEYYDFADDAKVIFNSDGAPWAKKVGTYIPHLAHASLDKFHWHREITRVLGNSSFASSVHSAIIQKDKNNLLAQLQKAQNTKAREKDKKPIDKLEGYLLDNWQGLSDYREKVDVDLEICRGLGAMESNIDRYANRFKKKGMSWSKEGAKNLVKVMNAASNGDLKGRLKEYKYNIQKEARKYFAGQQRKVATDRSSYPVKKGRMPALEGPHRDREWVKILKNLQSTSMLG